MGYRIPEEGGRVRVALADAIPPAAIRRCARVPDIVLFIQGIRSAI